MEIIRRHGLPGGRAVLGGVLMAVAVVGVFLAYARATEGSGEQAIVATRLIQPGHALERADLRAVKVDLPDVSAAASFDTFEAVVGRVALGPIGPGELVQVGSLSDDVSTPGVHEVALNLPRGQIAVGRLKSGERVDVFVTQDDRTVSVVRGAQVVQIADADSGSLTSSREISLVVSVPSGDAVAALVHALRTGDVTVVRSTLAGVATDQPLSFPTAATG